MDLLIAFLIFAATMIGGLVAAPNYGMLFALAVGAVCFYAVARHRGFQARDLFQMMFRGVKRSMIVLRIFLLIGLLTALWRASGTITFFVYHGVRLIPSSLFLVAGFGLTSLLAYALGTSYGTTGTVGVILITLARAGGVPPALMAGAVLSGAYFGDRTGPASSCANLVATVTETKLYDNLSRMLKSSVVPMVACFALYGALSPRYPLAAGEGGLIYLMARNYDMSLWCALPAVLMLILPLCKVPVRTAMTASIAAAAGVGLWVQHQSVGQLLTASLLGYVPADPQLAGILSGGGLLSMVKVACIVALSSTFSGIFDGTRMLEGLQEGLGRLADRLTVFGVMLLSSAGITAVFCNQTIGVMMAQQLLGPVYEKRGRSKEDVAIDIANSMVTLVGLCPWCIACAVPLSMLGVGIEALPWAAFLYLLPVWWLAVRLWQERKKPVAK